LKHILHILLLTSFAATARHTNNNPFESGRYVFSSWYVATTGNDATGDGSIGNPYKTWEKLRDVLTPGDIGYIRGGDYYPTKGMGVFQHCYWDNINGTAALPITIQNYPSETPVFNFNDSVITTNDAFVVFIEFCSYLIVKGLRVTSFDQISTGAGVSRGWAIQESNFIRIENSRADHMGGTGFQVGSNTLNLVFINCDSDNNADPFSPGDEYGGSDGFGINGGVTNISATFVTCRAIWNSDDGYDNFNTDVVITYIGCQSFWNGYIPGTFTTGGAGGGKGWKLGPTTTVPKVQVTRILSNCLAFENRTDGFSQQTAETQMSIINCIAYNNGNLGFWFDWYPSYAQPFYNNISYDNVAGDLDESGGNVGGSNNTWDGGVTVTDADFQSVSSTGMDGARNADGSLPGLTFLRLASTSDLINAGVYKQLPYCSTAPDLGAYEFNNCYLNLVRRRNSIH